MKPHKHAELIKAWADGAEIEYRCYLINGWTKWEVTNEPMWGLTDEFRIKPEPQTAEQQSGYSRLEWAEDLIKQLPKTHDGRNSWLLNYGSKPEPKPDVVKMFQATYQCAFEVKPYDANLKLTFDGETGKLKLAEVLK